MRRLNRCQGSQSQRAGCTPYHQALPLSVYSCAGALDWALPAMASADRLRSCWMLADCLAHKKRTTDTEGCSSFVFCFRHVSEQLYSFRGGSTPRCGPGGKTPHVGVLTPKPKSLVLKHA
jgi:hypothetical protein